MRLHFFAFAALPLLFLAACGSLPWAELADGEVYAYDFERVFYGIEQAARAHINGYEYSQLVKKASFGYAVAVSGRSFVVPELNLTLSIAEDGSVTSCENSTVRGTLAGDGLLSWQGLVVENGQTVQVTEKARLVKSLRSDRADSAFDGIYQLTGENGARLTLTVQDGLSVAQESDIALPFKPQPVIVAKDGSFTARFVLTTDQRMPGYGKTTFSTEYVSEGRLHAGGSASLQSAYTTAGTVASGKSSFVYSGDRLTQSLSDGSVRTLLAGTYAPGAGLASAAGRGQEPDWYTEDIVREDGAVTACAQHAEADAEIAKALAVAEASGKILSEIALRLSNQVRALADYGDEKSPRSLQSVIETVSALNLSYTVKRTAYDAKAGLAFAQVTASAEELARAQAAVRQGAQ